MSNTKPFPAEPATHPTVVAARETLREKHRTAVANAKAEYELRLEQRWEESERKRKFDWIDKKSYKAFLSALKTTLS